MGPVPCPQGACDSGVIRHPSSIMYPPSVTLYSVVLSVTSQPLSDAADASTPPHLVQLEVLRPLSSLLTHHSSVNRHCL